MKLTLLAAIAVLLTGCWAEDISGYESPRRREAAYIGPEGQSTGPVRATRPTPGDDDFAPPDRPPGRMPGATVPSLGEPIVSVAVPVPAPEPPTSVPLPEPGPEPGETQAIPLPPE